MYIQISIHATTYMIAFYNNQLYRTVFVMGKILISLDDDLEDKFRKTVGARIGVKRGALAEALEEAIKLWITKKH
jgi:hypothetical protein